MQPRERKSHFGAQEKGGRAVRRRSRGARAPEAPIRLEPAWPLEKVGTHRGCTPGSQPGLLPGTGPSSPWSAQRGDGETPNRLPCVINPRAHTEPGGEKRKRMPGVILTFRNPTPVNRGTPEGKFRGLMQLGGRLLPASVKISAPRAPRLRLASGTPGGRGWGGSPAAGAALARPLARSGLLPSVQPPAGPPQPSTARAV